MPNPPEITQGYVLRLRPLTETSSIVHWLTDTHGRIGTVAKGARRAKSPFAGRLDLGAHCRFSFQRARTGDLHTLREVELETPRSTLPSDYKALVQLAYITELLESTTEPDTPIPEFFQLYRDYRLKLDESGPRIRYLFAFELKLLRLQGFDSAERGHSLPAGLNTLIHPLLETEWHAMDQIQAPAESNGKSLISGIRGWLELELQSAFEWSARLKRRRDEACGGR